MHQSPRAASHPNTVGKWLINLIWIIFWAAVSFAAMDVFGSTVTYILLPILFIGTILIWMLTSRRDRLHNLDEEEKQA
jgi:Sec-independent protein secretion pathway component TatC